MNELEKLGLKKAKEHLFSAVSRCDEKNSERMNHERIHLLADIKDALKVIDAIQENNTK